MTPCADSTCRQPATVKVAMAGSQHPDVHVLCGEHADQFCAYADGPVKCIPVICDVNARHPFEQEAKP
jgi:hypothetical protein